ncbi:MAG: 50S ribosomal protein L33 [Mycoplasma sp.]|nr:50S ribosomal protein L33 [Mycoplasma sp.]
MAVKRGIRLECSSCNEINYLTFKNSKKHPEKLELKKYCSRCQKSQLHKETKKK